MPARQKPDFGGGGRLGGIGIPHAAIAALVFAIIIETLMVIMLFGAFADTMGIMSDVNLCDQPAI